MENIGKLLNFVVCLMVFAGGFYWMISLDQKWRDEHRFLYRAFTCWWLSWFIWLVLWTLILFVVPKNQNTRNLISLLLTDLNMIFLIMVYFFLTRGNQFRITDALIRSIGIIIVLAVSYGVLYPYFEDFNAALKLQERWELCLGIVTTMLLGWAFSLRFNTKIVLIVGYVYGFCQPLAYESLLHDEKNQIPLVVLAFLKVVLATVVTGYFIQEPKTTENLVMELNSRSQSALFQFRNWTRQLTLQTITLIIVFGLLLLWRMPQDQLAAIMVRIGQVTFFCGSLMVIAKTWSYVNSKFNDKNRDNAKDDKQKE